MGKEGYPFQAYKNHFKTDTSHLTFFGWKLYRATPFMWELKVITDWTVTATCLELTQWFILDDIYNTLYASQRSNDERSKRPQVSKRQVWEKLMIGASFA